MDVSKLLEQQKTYFKSGATKSVDFRIHQLNTLKKLLTEHEDELNQAVYKDFRKSPFETYSSEIGLVHEEINYAIKHLKKWAKPTRVSTSLVNFPSKNYIISEPYGTVLVFSPWNYPVQLALLPVVGAIAAGNTVVIKPSEVSTHTSATLAKLLGKWFKEAYVAVVEGGVEISQELLKQKFDYIFFTGSSRVGKIVMKAAAENLIPVTLELGGKSPCIIDETADLQKTAKRIAWGKLLNAGQTCIAPDYVLVPEKMQSKFLEYLKQAIINLYGVNPKLSPDFPRIINDFHYKRLKGLLDEEKIYSGGKLDAEERYIEPTILHHISADDKVMQEEIFGPILPVISYKELPQALEIINSKPKPLALYLFTTDSEVEQLVMQNCSFGGGMVNDVLVHILNQKLPFGGVGNSGMGAYHGKNSFDTFSHQKGIVKKSFWLDNPLRYPPYKEKLKLIKRILK